jgi:Bacterial pre-peptidase C-terminal domain
MLVSGVFVGQLLAQDCPAVARVQPAGVFGGALDAASCLLSDGSPYAAYRLDLPVRGQIQFDLSSAGDFALILRDDSGARLDSGTSIHRPIEAGSYTLLVSGKSSGAYQIASSFTAEPSILCSGFPNIGWQQTVSAVLGSYGCLAPDGTSYDAYTLVTSGSGTLTVKAASQDFAPSIVLRGSDGHALANSIDGVLISPVAGDSQYQIVVASTGADGGSYQITTAFQSAFDETCTSRNTYTGSNSATSAIDSNSCTFTIPDSGDQLYYDYYNVTLAAPGIATLTVSSLDFTPTIYLLDEAGNTLAIDAAGGGYGPSGEAQSYVRIPLPAGNYMVQVFSDMASGGSYQFQYAFDTSPPQKCPAIPMNPGDAPIGGLSTASCRTTYGLSDLYTITLPSAGTLELDLGSLAFDAILALRDSKDNLIVRNEEVDGVTAAHISADLPAGVYTVVAAADSYSGQYQLTSKFTAHDIPACTFTQALDLNGGYIQRLGPASCRAANGQPVDYYGFTLSADSLVLAVMTSREVDGYLTLYGAAGNPVRSDDNGYGAFDPLIIQYLPAGAYKVAVRGASATLGGLYEIDLRTVPGPRPPLCTARASLSPGGSVTGNITYTGCQYTDLTFADIYQLNLTADGTLDLKLNSADFDAYLVLMDAKGNVVDEDDDSGGNTNARITRPLAAGTYYVVAKPLGDFLAHGAYTLSAAVTP